MSTTIFVIQISKLLSKRAISYDSETDDFTQQTITEVLPEIIIMKRIEEDVVSKNTDEASSVLAEYFQIISETRVRLVSEALKSVFKIFFLQNLDKHLKTDLLHNIAAQTSTLIVIIRH